MSLAYCSPCEVLFHDPSKPCPRCGQMGRFADIRAEETQWGTFTEPDPQPGYTGLRIQRDIAVDTGPYVMRAEDAAEFLGISGSTLRRYRAQGHIPYVRYINEMGKQGCVAYRTQDLRDFVDSCVVRGGSDA